MQYPSLPVRESRPPRVRSRPRAHAGALVLLLGVVAIGARVWLAWPIRPSWISDETIYVALARSLYSTQTLHILGGAAGFYSLVYPALLGATMLPHLTVAPTVLELVQLPVMGTSALIVYRWGASFVPRRWALAAAALTLALPGLSYASLAMSEVVYVPLFVLATWLIQRTLESPTLLRQGFMLGAIALVALTRLQGLILFPIFAVSAVLVFLAERRPPRQALRLLPTLVAGVLFFLAALTVQADPGSGGGAFGAYDGSTWLGPPGGSLRWTLVEFAVAALGGGVLPFATLLPAVKSAFARDARPVLRTSVITIAVAAVLVPLQAGLFMAGNAVERPVGRYCIAVLPLELLAFAAWGARGLARPTRLVAVACAATVALVAAIPGSALEVPTMWDNFALVPLWRLAGLLSSTATAHAVVALAAAAALSLLWLPRRFRVAVLPVALAWVVLTTVVSSREVAAASSEWVRQTAGVEPRWLDDRYVFTPKTFVFSSDLDGELVDKSVFWNSTLDRIALMPLSRPAGGPFPQEQLAVDSSGVVHVLGQDEAPLGPLVVASPRIRFQGVRVAQNPQTGLVLWYLDSPPRVLEWVEGWLDPARRVRPVSGADPVLSGWSAKLFDYRCSPAKRARLRFSAEQNGTLTISDSRRVVEQFPYRPGREFRRVIRVEPDDQGRCELRLGATTQISLESFGIS